MRWVAYGPTWDVGPSLASPAARERAPEPSAPEIV